MDKSHFIFSTQELIEYLIHRGIDAYTIVGSREWVDHPFSILVPKYYLDLIEWANPHDPLRLMVIPDKQEKDIHPYELEDPIGDKVRTAVAGIIHRYPDRCLLNLTAACPVHCRFCFRKNILPTPDVARYHESIEYIRTHPQIWEVILSGGDPFTIPDTFLKTVMTDLRTISHVKIIRFHTRTPAVYPHRVTPAFASILKAAAPTIVVIHINHPQEITSEFIQAVDLLKSYGAMLLSQTVLLKDINADAATLAVLFKKLVEIGVKPYYLHHLDPAAGTHHFRVSVTKGKKIMHELRGHISGHCIPEYVIDIPGGYGKIPVYWFSSIENRIYEATSFEGEKIRYQDHCVRG